MFQEDYKKAYEGIVPSERALNLLLEKAGLAEENRREKAVQRRSRCLRWAMTAAAACLCIVLAVPVCAKNIPAFYKILESVSPRLAELLAPVEKSDTKHGITMTVEAAYIENGRAKVVLSFADAESSREDRVHGEIGVYSFSLESGSRTQSAIGGSSFLAYDEETGKAFYQVDLTALEGDFHDKLTLYVGRIFLNMDRGRMDIDIASLPRLDSLKEVRLSGRGGGRSGRDITEILNQWKVDDMTVMIPSPSYAVMDRGEEISCATDDLTVAGLSYRDGLLRVQVCRGEYADADRHLQPVLVDEQGEEIYYDASLSWSEEIDGKTCSFEEFWFAGDFENLEGYSMYGLYHRYDGYLKGDWQVDFKLDDAAKQE